MSLRSQKVNVVARVGSETGSLGKVASSTQTSATSAKDRMDDDDKESIDWTAKLVEELSGLYGYAILSSGITVSFIVGISEIPFTIWNGVTGKPEVNKLAT